MPKKYPPLTPQEVIAILRAWGFIKDGQTGSHQQWSGTIKGRRRPVTVDVHYAEFDDDIIKSMIFQSGLSREEFYCAEKNLAKKINQKYRKPKL